MLQDLLGHLSGLEDQLVCLSLHSYGIGDSRCARSHSLHDDCHLYHLYLELTLASRRLVLSFWLRRPLSRVSQGQVSLALLWE